MWLQTLCDSCAVCAQKSRELTNKLEGLETSGWTKPFFFFFWSPWQHAACLQSEWAVRGSVGLQSAPAVTNRLYQAKKINSAGQGRIWLSLSITAELNSFINTNRFRQREPPGIKLPTLPCNTTVYLSGKVPFRPPLPLFLCFVSAEETL